MPMSRLSLRIIDLKGYRFGRWRVLEEAVSVKYAGGFHRMWRCVCECDIEKVVSQGHLLRGKTRGCMKCRDLDDSSAL
jgi:hypothetical protein